MLKPKPPQNSFYGSYLYDRIIPPDHLLRKINEVVDFSFINDLVKDRYTSDFGRPAPWLRSFAAFQDDKRGRRVNVPNEKTKRRASLT